MPARKPAEDGQSREGEVAHHIAPFKEEEETERIEEAALNDPLHEWFTVALRGGHLHHRAERKVNRDEDEEDGGDILTHEGNALAREIDRLLDHIVDGLRKVIGDNKVYKTAVGIRMRVSVGVAAALRFLKFEQPRDIQPRIDW